MMSLTRQDIVKDSEKLTSSALKNKCLFSHQFWIRLCNFQHVDGLVISGHHIPHKYRKAHFYLFVAAQKMFVLISQGSATLLKTRFHSVKSSSSDLLGFCVVGTAHPEKVSRVNLVQRFG